MSKIYSVETQSIFTGTGIEGYTFNPFFFIDKKKAFQFAYKLAKEHAIYNGLPVTDESLFNYPCRITKKTNLAPIDSNFNIKKLNLTGKYFDNYMKQKLIKGDVEIGCLEISNNYRWLDDGGFKFNGYAIYIFENDYNEDNDVVFQAWINENK